MNIELYHDKSNMFADPWTLIIDNDIYTMSDNPLSPQGVNMFFSTLDTKNKAEQAMVEFIKEQERIEITEAPQEIRKAILYRLANHLNCLIRML